MKMLKISQQNKMLLISFVVLIICYFAFSPKKDGPANSKKEPIYADTMIPKGYVLIPVELANADSMAALMDQYGVVDLYSGSATARGSRKIATKVKILRAPLNPNQYAVLVPDQLSNLIMSTPGPFWAVVQNRETKQDENAEKKIHPVRIEYQN